MIITTTFPDGSCEEYDTAYKCDVHALEYKLRARIQALKKGEQIIIEGAGQ